jgi:ATP-dependent helicase/DNAse subunit B
MIQPDDHFNSEALRMVAAALEDIGPQTLPLNELVDLVESLLKDATVKPRESHEQGVWILNPYDAVGLQFDLVFLAGLNEGEFPAVPQQDALLGDKERYGLRRHLEEQGRPLPRMALPEASVRYEQESVMFLSALGMAREHLVCSCQAVDKEGNEKSESEYYRKLWNLAGWCTQDHVVLSPYNQWRTEQLETQNLFTRHAETQQQADPADRIPMPGESFLPIVPLPLCRAGDEALQAAVQDRRTACGPKVAPQASRLLKHLVSMSRIEAERDAYLETPVAQRTPSKYCGHIEALKEKVADWFDQRHEISPTALETLAHCRYIFLLEKVFGLEDVRELDDMPDPMDRGTLIHSILKTIYTSIAGGEAGIDAPRNWAVKTGTGWRKESDRVGDAIPLVTFNPGKSSEYEAFAEKIATAHLKQGGSGHPAVWEAEQEKVLEQILNFVRYDLNTCADEHRFPALFELRFNGDSAVDLGDVRLRGRVDRVDLCFADSGELTKLRVLDYKGASRSRRQREDYIREIRNNLDCQLPVYAFAAQQFFFGAHNNKEINAMTEAGYLFYRRKMKEVGSDLKKCLLPMDEEGLLDGFLDTLHKNIVRLKNGDFAVDPLVEAYNDYQSVCRTEAVALEEME